MLNEVSRSVEELLTYTSERKYFGYDPFDALNSALIRKLSFGQKWGRIAWIQFLKRSPINLRKALLVKQGQNPKGLGLFLGGLSRLAVTSPRERVDQEISYVIQALADCRSEGCVGNGWGYNFDWQSRAFYVPANTPTIVNSSFIGHALLDTYELTGKETALDLALPIKDFILKSLNRTNSGDEFCFSYTPLDKTCIHNANLLGASLLIRLWQIVGEEDMRDAALSSLAYSMARQRDDGSWFYANTADQKWIDSFHTGFNLEAMRSFLILPECTHYAPHYEKGVKFYASAFFLDDGAPKYYHDRLYPIDIHAPAEAVYFFSGEGYPYRALTERVMSWTLRNMKAQTGYFYFRKGRFVTNKVSYMRWSQAWMFRALTEYLYRYRTITE